RHADNSEFTGGEQTALKMMNQFLADPGNAGKESRLSPYIASGALSPNTFYHALIESDSLVSDRKSLEFHLQKLYWRDYYRFMLKKHGNAFFQRTGVNGALPPDAPDGDDAEFEKWKSARTDEPAIDEGMRL